MSERRNIWTLGSGTLILTKGDLTGADVDAIVNAANSALAGGGGVDGAIHMAAGPELLAACQEIVKRQGRLPPGQAVITPGFSLPARHVIHTVGPIWRGGGNRELEILASAYTSSLELAYTNHVRTIAFPAISCGVYGYPQDQAARVALRAVADGLKRGLVESAAFYLYSDGSLRTWTIAAEELLGPPEH